ncbi:acyl-CoA synthetase domain protein [Mycobacterium xenopi 3993]|nr:acyl-CoA synthetase domain protein [Mycobacterium xenopi 3993]
MTWATIPEMVLSAADRFGDAEAVVDGSLRLTFAQLVDRIRCAAGHSRVSASTRATEWPSGRPTAPNGSSPRSAC